MVLPTKPYGISTGYPSYGFALTEPPQKQPPLCFQLKARGGQGAVFFPEKKIIALPVTSEPPISNGELIIWNYETGEEAAALKLSGSVSLKLHENRGIIFAYYINAESVFAWNLIEGKPVNLPQTWNVTDWFCYGKQFIVQIPNKGEEREKKNRIFNFFDPVNFTLIKSLEVDIASILDMKIYEDKFILLGRKNDLHSKNQSLSNPYDGVIITYNMTTGTLLQAKFDCDFLFCTPSLEIQDGIIYNTCWTQSKNYLWNLNTLEAILIKPVTHISLTKILEDKIVIVDAKEIVIYETGNPTKKKEPIQVEVNNPIKSIELFRYGNECYLAEGHEKGNIIVRSLETGKINWVIESHGLISSDNAIQFCHNKLLVRYDIPLSEGVYGIVWNFEYKNAYLKISSYKLKNHEHAFTEICIFGDSLYARCYDEVKFFKDLFKI